MASSLEAEQSVVDYRKSVRDKASDAISKLRQILDHEPVMQAGSRQRRVTDSEAGVGDADAAVEHCDYSYGAASDRLRSMLALSPPAPSRTVLFDDATSLRPAAAASVADKRTRVLSVPLMTSDVSTGDEMSQLMRSQAQQLQLVTSLNNQLKTDMEKLKWRMLEVVEENRVLHAELKKSVVTEMLNAGVPVSSTPATVRISPPSSTSPSRPLTHFDHEKWRTELERISSLHDAKTTTLEAQLQYAKEECVHHERHAGEVEAKLHALESAVHSDGRLMFSVGGVGGMCIRCAENEALLPAPSHVVSQRAVDSLTRERDELASQVSVMKVRLTEMASRESDAYQQMKACIELAEQSQLDMSQAVIEREQARELADNMRQRFEETMSRMQQTIADECDLVRREGQTTREQLESRVKELVAQLAEMQCNIDKCTREKMAVTAELEVARSQLSDVDVDYSKATDNMKVGMAQATVERNLAFQQLTRLKNEIDQLHSDRHAERSRLKSELEEVTRRLHTAEKEVLVAKDDCVKLHEANQTLQNEVYAVRLAKENMERSYSDHIDAAERRAEQREADLNIVVEKLQTKQARSTSELENLVHQHELLIHRLRDECRHLVKELEQVSTKYKAENSRLRRQNEQLSVKVERTCRQCAELTNRLSQQSQLQEKMRLRLHHLDSDIQRSSQQKLDLLAKESVLLRDRQQLARHVEFLQHQLMPAAGDAGKPNWENLTSSDALYIGSRILTDDVMRRAAAAKDDKPQRDDDDDDNDNDERVESEKPYSSPRSSTPVEHTD